MVVLSLKKNEIMELALTLENSTFSNGAKFSMLEVLKKFKKALTRRAEKFAIQTIIDDFRFRHNFSDSTYKKKGK